MQAKNIALLGGTGFVGSALIPRLTDAGHYVTVISRHPERHRELQLAPQARLLRARVTHAASLSAALAGNDAVINLIGILNSRGRDGRDFTRLHAELPGQIASQCRELGIDRLLHMSALRADADKGASQYLRSKGAGESAVRREAGNSVACTIFQPSVIFGTGDSFINRFAGLLRLPAPMLPLPAPNARFAPVWVGDVAQAFVQALDDPNTFGKTYQLCGPQVLSLREIVSLIRTALDVRRSIVGMPDSLAKMQAGLMEFVPGKPFSLDNWRSLQVNSICDSNGFEKLGIEPRSVTPWIERHAAGAGRRRFLSAYRERANRQVR